MTPRSGIALTESQRIAWLRLIRSDNVGPVTFRELINHYGSAEAALERLPELAGRGGAQKRFRVASVAEAEAELETAARHKGRFVAIGEPDYPPALRAIDGAPPLLAMSGSGDVATRPALGIVGARNASVAGAKFTAMIASAAAGAGYTVVSGLARGIDAAAHRASLAHGTLAALAGGLDRPYPPENIELYRAICEDGGVAISEMPYGWEPRARDFPRRNRLIAGASLAVVVIEAAVPLDGDAADGGIFLHGDDQAVAHRVDRDGFEQAGLLQPLKRVVHLSAADRLARDEARIGQDRRRLDALVALHLELGEPELLGLC